MPLRTRLILIISLGLAVVVGILLFVRYKPAAKAPETTDGITTPNVIDSTNIENRTSVTPTVVPVGTPIKPATTLEAEQNGVRQLAKVFVERYNSYSTDNNLQNIRDVQELVTPSLWAKIGARLNVPVQPATTFSEVTSEVISAVMGKWSVEEATITIKAKKTTETGGQKTETYQTTSVVMVKQGEIWLVGSFKNE